MNPPRISVARRRLLAGIGAMATAPFASAQQPATRAGAAPGIWHLLVNEAVTGDTNGFVLTSRYRPLADYLASQARVKDVMVEPVVDIKSFMALAQAPHKPELVFGKSVNQLAKLVRDHGYQPLVRRAEPYRAAFVVGKDSPIRTLADLASATVIMPDEFAATSAVARAELRRQKVSAGKVVHVKYQEMVAMEIKAGLGQVGVVNPTVAKKWAEEGGRLLAETQPVVNWSLLASPALAATTVARLREALLAMNAQPHPALAQIGIKAWAEAGKQDYLELLAYTGE